MPASPLPTREGLGVRDGVEIFSKPPTEDGIVSFKEIAELDAAAGDGRA